MGKRRRDVTPSDVSCNREGEGEGEEGTRESVLTRERGRPAGQERRSLNAVPGSAAEAEAVAAIRLLMRVAGDGGAGDARPPGSPARSFGGQRQVQEGGAA
jgi:hypothetical protein